MAIDAEENYFGILTSNMVVVYNSNLEKQFTTGILTGNKGLLIDEGGAHMSYQRLRRLYIANGDFCEHTNT